MKNYLLNSMLYLLVVSFFAYCAVNPVSGKKQIMLVSEAQELAMGQEADPQIIREFGLYPDSSLQRYVNQQGQAIARVSHRPNVAYHFRVLDTDVVNAFAVPGGYVYFTRGIMAYLNNEAQLSGVLGHEVGHIAARHGTLQQTNQTLAQLGLMVAVIADERLAKFADAANQGLQLMFLKYSRDDESASDELGVQYSSQVGYQALEMGKFFLTLERNNPPSASSLPTFLSTHPDPGNRYNTVNKLAKDYQTKNNLTNLKINRNAYLQLIDNMIYGADPRQGYMDNAVFYHPALRFRFSTPVGWTYSNTPSQVTFAPKEGTAVFFLRQAPGNTPEAAAQTFVQQTQFKVSESYTVFVNGMNTYVIVGDQVAQTSQGQTSPAVRAMLYFIQYNNDIYVMAGASAPENFNSYKPAFQQYMNSFNQLTDAIHLNRQPERIHIKSLNSTATLQQALSIFSVPAGRHAEMAVLNGMQLTDQVPAGTLLKIVAR